MFNIYPTISIRVANARKSQLCNTQVRLLLLRREVDGIHLNSILNVNNNDSNNALF